MSIVSKDTMPQAILRLGAQCIDDGRTGGFAQELLVRRSFNDLRSGQPWCIPPVMAESIDKSLSAPIAKWRMGDQALPTQGQASSIGHLDLQARLVNENQSIQMVDYKGGRFVTQFTTQLSSIRELLLKRMQVFLVSPRSRITRFIRSLLHNTVTPGRHRKMALTSVPMAISAQITKYFGLGSPGIIAKVVNVHLREEIKFFKNFL